MILLLSGKQNNDTENFSNSFDISFERLNKCTPESFNTNISHKFFDCKITFINLQQKNTNTKGFRCLFDRFLIYKNKSNLD